MDQFPVRGIDLLKTGASHQVDMDRDETDSFALSVVPLEEITPLRKESVLALVPPGSRWIQARGWSSYFGLPLTIDDVVWWAVGAECVVKHATRGAYPKLRAYLHRQNDTAERAVLAVARLLNFEANYQQVTYVIVKRAVMHFDARTPQEMDRPQSDLLVRVAHAYRNRERVMFRTLLLCEQEAQPLALLGGGRSWERRQVSRWLRPADRRNVLVEDPCGS